MSKKRSRQTQVATPQGLAIERTEINFIYSFLCRIRSFHELKKKWGEVAVKLGSHGDLQHEATSRSEMEERLYGKKADQSLPHNTCFWFTGRHPERNGLSPLLELTRTTAGSPDPIAHEELSCYARCNGPILVRNSPKSSDFASPIECSDKALDAKVDYYDAILRLADNGQGSVTFRMKLEDDCFGTSNEMQKLHSNHGLLPFLFVILNLARTEMNSSRNGVPVSKIISLAEKPGEGSFRTLHSIFHTFLFDTVLSAVARFVDDSSRFCSVDWELVESHPGTVDREHVESHPDTGESGEVWMRQAPYVCTFIDLDRDRTQVRFVDDSGVTPRDKAPWWLHAYEKSRKRRSAEDHRKSLPTQALAPNVSVDIERCYRETTLLVLRLYQWRTILGLDPDAVREREPDETRWPDNLHRVPVLPDLLQETSQGHLFKDVDLVWDTRYLMLYHERSTLLLNCVEESLDEARSPSPSFKDLFRHSLLDTLESARAQWHGALVTSQSLDAIIAEITKNHNQVRNAKLIWRIALVRASYATLLRAPLTAGTDAAALAEIQRRAYDAYGIDMLVQNLHDKSVSINGLLADQQHIINLIGDDEDQSDG